MALQRAVHFAGVVTPGLGHIKQMQLFGFEPHQTELSHFMPGILIDITETYEKKVKAMECFQAQGHLIEYYKERAFLRGNHARRLSGDNSYKYAECFPATSRSSRRNLSKSLKTAP